MYALIKTYFGFGFISSKINSDIAIRINIIFGTNKHTIYT